MIVLVDTSIWIAFFKSPKSADARNLDVLLEEGSVCICGLVEAELLPGLKQADRRKVRALLAGIPHVETPEQIWDVVSDIQATALDKGIGPFSIPDLIIAAVALHHGLHVFTRDRHFIDIAKVAKLNLWSENPKRMKAHQAKS
jgi:predicted nucleic acid-binding protein